MGTIEYLYHSDDVRKCPIKVRLDGKVCGEIVEVGLGYKYVPKGAFSGGDVYQTIEGVQDSLEIT